MNCKGKVSAIVHIDGKYKMSSIVYEHNHVLVYQTKLDFLKQIEV